MTYKKYYKIKSINYPVGTARQHSIALLVKNIQGKRILDVGCGIGILGERLKAANNYVEGWDISKGAVTEARRKLDKAFEVDLSDEKWPICKDKFDLIICSEVLEHLLQPDYAMKRLVSGYLKDSGSMLISTPNFLYFINRLKFLVGIFRYEKRGMFDESHIHFFTFSTLKEVIDKNGLRIVGEQHTFALGFMSILSKLFPSIFAYQFVVLCKKK